MMEAFWWIIIACLVVRNIVSILEVFMDFHLLWWREPPEIKQLRRLSHYIGLEVKKTRSGQWFVGDPTQTGDLFATVMFPGNFFENNPKKLLSSFLATEFFILKPSNGGLDILKNPFYGKTDEEIQIVLDLDKPIT